MLLTKIIFLVFMCMLCNYSKAQNEVGYVVEILEVSFLDNIQHIRSDALASFESEYTTPHWSPMDSKPIAYSSEDTLSTIKVKATFHYSCVNPPEDTIVWIKGESTDSFNFGIIPCVLEFISNGLYEIKYPESESDKFLTKNKIRYFSSFIIDWKISFEEPDALGSAVWDPIGSSDNPLYVTYNNPIPGKLPTDTLIVVEPLRGYQWYHSLFKISCEFGKQNNNSSPDSIHQIIDSIWNFVSGLNLTAVEDDAILTYYNNWEEYNCYAVDTRALLFFKDGQCGSFTRLFLDLLYVQGITQPPEENFIWVEPKTNIVDISAPDYIFIKDFDGMVQHPLGEFIEGLKPPYNYAFVVQENPNDFTYTPGELDTLLEGSQFNWLYTEIIDEAGIPGQSNSNPKPIFSNHQIAQLNSVYYDPSYGVIYDDLADMETKAIAAYGRTFTTTLIESDYNADFNGDGDNDDTVYMLFFALSADMDSFELFKNEMKSEVH